MIKLYPLSPSPDMDSTESDSVPPRQMWFHMAPVRDELKIFLFCGLLP